MLRLITGCVTMWRIHFFNSHYPTTTEGFKNAALKQWMLRGHNLHTAIQTCEVCRDYVIVER